MCPASTDQNLSLKQAILAGSGVSVKALVDTNRKALDAKLNGRLGKEFDRLGKELDPQTARAIAGAKFDFRNHRDRTLTRQ